MKRVEGVEDLNSRIICAQGIVGVGAIIRIVHMIVPGGGISLDGTHWVRCRPGFLLPVRVLSRLFRRLFLTRLADAHAAGRLVFFGELDGLRNRTAFATLSRAAAGRRSGSSTPRRLLPGPRRCSPISLATPTASPSRTAD